MSEPSDIEGLERRLGEVRALARELAAEVREQFASTCRDLLFPG